METKYLWHSASTVTDKQDREGRKDVCEGKDGKKTAKPALVSSLMTKRGAGGVRVSAGG